MSNIKVGDKVVCISGFSTTVGSLNPKYGGSGYEEGRTFVVNKIDSQSRPVVWEKNISYGVYLDAVRLVSSEPDYEIY